MTDIAVIGIGCRLPGAEGPEQFWKLLREGADAIGPVPPDRWPSGEGTEWGGFVENAGAFDHSHFSISVREAERMDVQQRLALEVVRSSLEDAGIASEGLAGSRTGVYFGVSTYDHGAALFSAPGGDVHDGTGGALSIVANRVSYWLDLRGPSMIVDTACSSSLVAVRLAAGALAAEEVDLAFAGGVNFMSSPEIAARFARSGLMAEGGRCRAFDWKASGYVRSEGAGVVVLKRLDRARAEGDRVYCVIKGSAVNQDGRSNGITAPSRAAQEEVLRAAYAEAEILPSDVSYVEAHGTGTPVGDPIEIAALASVLGAQRDSAMPLRVGSVKSNVGHLEAAAGIAGLIKLALSLREGVLPPSLHFEQPNPMLGLERLPVCVQTSCEAWPGTPEQRTAGISSFGFGGTNAHLVLAAAEPSEVPAPPARPYLMPISAQEEELVGARCGAFAELAREGSENPGWWGRAAAAAALRQGQLRYRAAAIAESAAEGAEVLDDLAILSSSAPAGRRRPGRRPRIAFVFSGQGSQHDGMGAGLCTELPGFEASLRECADAEGRPLLDPEAPPRGDRVRSVQPALFALQVALAAAWRKWGIAPTAVVGHSMGEVAAARIAGCLSLPDAVEVIQKRSALLGEIEKQGALLLVELGQEEAAGEIEGDPELSVAAVNGPRSTLLAGSPPAVERVEQQLAARSVFVRQVAVDVAAHSPQVEPLRARLGEALAAIAPEPEGIPFYSTVEAAPIPGEELDASYWERNLREPVLFGETVERMIDDGFDTFLEISPHPVLTQTVASLLPPDEAVAVPSLRRDEGELRSLLRAAGELFVSGADPDWQALFPQGAHHLKMPPQARRRRSLPILPAARAGSGRGHGVPDGLVGPAVPVCSEPGLQLHELAIDLTAAPELADHRLEGVACVPAAYWLDAVATTAAARLRASAVGLKDVRLEHLKQVEEAPADSTQLSLRPAEDGALSFAIHSAAADGPATRHASGLVAMASEMPQGEPVAVISERCAHEVTGEGCYEVLQRHGLEYGERFRRLEQLRVCAGEALGSVRNEDDLLGSGLLHPAVVDACLHAIVLTVPEIEGVVPVPASVGEVWMRVSGPAPRQLWSHVKLKSQTEDELVCDVRLIDALGVPAWQASELRVHLSRRSEPAGGAHPVEWMPQDPPAAGGKRGNWLVLGESEVARAIKEGLWERGCAVTAQLGPGLLGIVDARGCETPDDPAGGLRDLSRDGLALAHEMLGQSWGSQLPRLWILTRGAVEPGGEEASALAAGALLGLGRTLANEAPELRPSLVDFEGPATPAQLGRLLDLLLAPQAPRQTMIRGDQLLSPRLLPPLGVDVEPPRLDGERSYVISGGLGDLGLWSAGWLAERGARHLLLLGRQGPSAAAEAEIRRLGDGGVEIQVERVDVADLSALRNALRTARRPIAGVVHTAGALVSGMIQEIGPDHLEAAARGKANGAWNFHSLSLEEPFDLFVMFSSLAGLVGSPGQGAYAAANSFLDSLARHRRALGLPALSVDWGTWRGSKLAASGGGSAQLAARGVLPLRREEAGALLDQALCSEHPQVVIGAFDWRSLSPRGRIEEELLGDLSGVRKGGQPAPGRAAVEVLEPGPMRQRLLREHLRESAARVLRQAPAEIDSGVAFHDLGFDSLMAMELRDLLEASLGMTLSATILWAHPTIDQLAEELLARIDSEGVDREGAVVEASEEAVSLDLAALDDRELETLLDSELDLLEGR